MAQYEVLLKVLDRLCREAPSAYKRYHPDSRDAEATNAARSLAFIHLLLKVYFGLTAFEDRDKYITDGTDDGGIDAYFIDGDRKRIYFVQSKFRTTEKNFEAKWIEAEELLAMDIDRILQGEIQSEDGTRYNGKVLEMARRIRAIEDIARYQYHVLVLANARGLTRAKLQLLTGGFPAELIDYQTCYSRLVFPLVSGTFYSADELHLSLSLSNKNAGAKISYTVTTEFAKCEITVVFVPTLEIAKAMYKYRNSILKYNPRSYLEHAGQLVNADIRKSIEERKTNEFALFNNGITMVSDESYLNERIGQKERAQLTVVNPQIINGGQTAYTLSLVYHDHLNQDTSAVFGEKEVLLKIITFDNVSQIPEDKRLSLIEDISRATNQQTAVTKADRRSNEPALKRLQQLAFEKLGLFLERKRGEFADGLRDGYLTESAVVDRATFFRVAFAALGRIDAAATKKLPAIADFELITNVSDDTLATYKIGLQLLAVLQEKGRKSKTFRRLRLPIMTQLYAAIEVAKHRFPNNDADSESLAALGTEIASRWNLFMAFSAVKHNTKFAAEGEREGRKPFSLSKYARERYLKTDAVEFFRLKSQE